jgi:hypothetical protein
MRDAPKCASCGHVEADHDGYAGLCDGGICVSSREMCGCLAFVTNAPPRRSIADSVGRHPPTDTSRLERAVRVLAQRKTPRPTPPP